MLSANDSCSMASARRMLTIEQFQNPMLAELQTKQNYTDVLRYFTALVQFLVRAGSLRDTGDAMVTAAQLSFPITVWINLCDREPEREDEVMALIERHVRCFFRLYRPAE